MHFHFPLLHLRAALLWGALASAILPGAAVAEVAVEPAWQVPFPSLAGHAYQLETGAGAEDEWSPASEVVFGTGGEITFAGRVSEVPPTHAHFRVAEVDPNSVGLAPATLQRNQTLTLTEEVGSPQILLLTATKGIYRLAEGKPYSMTWSYVKTGANTGRLTMTLSSGTLAVVEIDFASAHGGKFIRRFLTPAQVVTDTSGGLFALSDRPVWSTSLGTMPTNLVGATYTIHFGGEPITLHFDATTLTRQVGTSPPETINYTYEPETSTVGLIQLSGATGGILEELRLTALSPTAGSVERTRFDDSTGQAGDHDSGNFTHTAPPDPGNTTAHCDAPPNADNLELEVTDNLSGVAHLTFGPSGEGVKSTRTGGTLQQNGYSYSYTRIDDKTGRIVTSTPVLDGDEVEEMTLHFTGEDDCAGSFEKKHYRNGDLVNSSSGSFSRDTGPPA